MPAALDPLGVGFRPHVRRVVDALSFAVDGPAEAAIFAWLDRLVEQNAVMDLTAARNAGELADLMLADAVVIARTLEPGCRLVDVGTGAGGPGLAIAILRPDVRVTLVEPMQKRIMFLRTAIAAAGVSNVELVRARGEQVAADGASFDVAVARATLPPPAWLRLGAKLVGARGKVWVLLARDLPPKLAPWRATHDETYVWPHTERSRRAVCYVR